MGVTACFFREPFARRNTLRSNHPRILYTTSAQAGLRAPDDPVRQSPHPVRNPLTLAFDTEPPKQHTAGVWEGDYRTTEEDVAGSYPEESGLQVHH